jgi:hypothetical protein
MKNLFLLPTDKPSRLYLWEDKLRIGDLTTAPKNLGISNQNIYITNDEEIKEEDWVFGMDGIFQYKGKVNLPDVELPKKIILTTDETLIADGVQAIDDEFLEWFVDNPSCEEVDIDVDLKYFNVDELRERHLKGLPHIYSEKIGYKIIIPQEELKPIHKFNSGLGATLCNECYVIISEGLTEDLYCEKCKHKQKLNSLVESWQKRQKEYESLAEKHRDSDHTYKKYTYRAQATRDCWKELLTFNKTTEGYYDDFKMIEGEKIEEAAKRFWKESKANPIEMAIFGAEWQQEQDLNLVQSYLSANLQNIELLEKSYSEEEVLKYLNHLIMMKSSELDKFTDDEETVTMKWFEQFKKK